MSHEIKPKCIMVSVMVASCCVTLGSLNGTFINGKHPEKDRSYPLKDRDSIGLVGPTDEIADRMAEVVFE